MIFIMLTTVNCVFKSKGVEWLNLTYNMNLYTILFIITGALAQAVKKMVHKILLLKQYLMNSHGSTVMFSCYVHFYYDYSFMLDMKANVSVYTHGIVYLISNLVFHFHSSSKDGSGNYRYWFVLLNGDACGWICSFSAQNYCWWSIDHFTVVCLVALP